MSEPTDPIVELAEELRCRVTQERCRDIYPAMCAIDEHLRASLGPEWRCSTCAVYVALRAQRTEGRPSWKFFVDGRVYDTTHPALNPMEIKQLAGVPLSDNLIAEGSIRQLMAEGKRLSLPDDEPIDLTGDPKHFHSVPQAHD